MQECITSTDTCLSFCTDFIDCFVDLDSRISNGGQEQLDIRVDGSIMADRVGLDPQTLARELLRLIDHLMQVKTYCFSSMRRGIDCSMR